MPQKLFRNYIQPLYSCWKQILFLLIFLVCIRFYFTAALGVPELARAFVPLPLIWVFIICLISLFNEPHLFNKKLKHNKVLLLSLLTIIIHFLVHLFIFGSSLRSLVTYAIPSAYMALFPGLLILLLNGERLNVKKSIFRHHMGMLTYDDRRILV